MCDTLSSCIRNINAFVCFVVEGHDLITGDGEKLLWNNIIDTIWVEEYTVLNKIEKRILKY